MGCVPVGLLQQPLAAGGSRRGAGSSAAPKQQAALQACTGWGDADPLHEEHQFLEREERRGRARGAPAGAAPRPTLGGRPPRRPAHRRAPDLPAQRRQLPAALPESGVQGQGDEAHLPGGGGEQPGDHYPYGGERVVSAEQTPRKGMIWSRMTASAVAIGARLKGCAPTSRGEPRSVCGAALL